MAAADDLLREVRFDAAGLVLAVAQQHDTGEVLMVAWMNADAIAETLATGRVCYWSRSRGALWRKGEISGQVQELKELRLDCDGDSILLLVDQTGVACHTGAPTGFVTRVGGEPAEAFAALADLERIIGERAEVADPESSYTARLLAKGMDTVCKKVGEEATEVVLAAKGGERDGVVYEAADLLYHLGVLLRASGVAFEEVAAELASRRRSG
jgi:phosphoribosyl-ATP pyrophosphohydrolase/phosphoribosyl-AMP cyclohydrolase